MIDKIKRSLSDKEILFILLKILKLDSSKELAVILDLDNFVKLSNVFDGSTIKIPKRKEVTKALKICLAYYYKYYCNHSWSEICNFIPEANSPHFKMEGIDLERELCPKVMKKFQTLIEVLKDDEGDVND